MKESSNKKIIKYIFLLGLFLVVLGTSYALFRITLTGRKKTRISTANFGLTLTDINGHEETDGIAVNLENAVPESDEEGLSRDGYKFVVTNTGSIPASYELKINGTGDLSINYIKYALIQKDYLKKSDGTYYNGGIYSNEAMWDVVNHNTKEAPKLNTLTNDILSKTTILPGEKIEYELKLWLDYDSSNEASNKIYEASIKVNGYQAEEYMSGKTGDTSKYTLYKDGTMIITGNGAIENSEISNFIQMKNNWGPFIDIVYNIANNHNILLPTIDNVGENNTSEMQEKIDQFNTLLKLSTITKGYPYEQNGDFAQRKLEMAELLKISEDDYDKLLVALRSSVIITRIVIDEGITNLDNAIYLFAGTGDYMITFPSTIEDVKNTGTSIALLYDYIGYGIVIPENIKNTNELIPEQIRYINLNNAEKVETINFYGKEITIPSTVRSIKINIKSNYNIITINIDNTREYVESHWDSNWLVTNGHNVTINYLR